MTRTLLQIFETTLGLSILSTVAIACTAPQPTSNPSPQTSIDPIEHNPTEMNHAGMDHNLDLGPADENYDLRFIDAMIPHHEGAIIMAEDLMQKTKRPELQKMAQDIIRTQTQEIIQMKQWRKSWYSQIPNEPMAWHSSRNPMMPMSKSQQEKMRMAVNLGTVDSGYDFRFLKAMIPHHEAAVRMSKDVMNKTKRPELKAIANAIIQSQQREIAQMRQWEIQWKK